MARELIRNMDYPLLVMVLALMIIGILMIHSASTGENMDSSDLWQRQLVWTVISVVAMLMVVPVPTKVLYSLAYIIYGCGIFLLVLTEFFGIRGGGSQSWLVIGSMRIQPSEFMKIGVILALARFLSEKTNRPTTYGKCLLPVMIVLVPIGLIFMQPDLGTAMVFASIVLPMLYWAGLDESRLFFVIAPVLSAIFTAPFIPFSHPLIWVVFMFLVLAVLYLARFSFAGMGAILGANIVAGIATPYIFNRLKPYQQTRITTIFHPEADPLGSGYQIIQSKIALGSGGLFGKGLGQGRYTELGFLPHAHTDFIFSVVGEELGFVGGLFILGLLSLVVMRGIRNAARAKTPFVSIAAVGISTVFAFHIIINIGVVVGIMPITGLPLPFLSYGGSSLLTNAVLVGLLMNFRVHRHEL